MADLFISYAKPDRSMATELADELRSRGFSVWIDQGGIGGAKNWSSEIVEAINSCSTMLVLLSSDSVASHNVAKEVQLASEKRKNILPVVIEKVTLPSVFEYPLVGLQRVYYHDRPAIFNALELLSGAIVTSRGADVSSAVSQPSPADSSVRVAVLPFDDLSPKHDNQWFADGMMDELISTLGHLDKVKVPGRSDVLHYRDRRAKSREIARELGVRYIIEGGVRKSGKKIRINASLIDTQQAEQLWANQFDGTFHDVFAFQEMVSRNITDALKLQLSPHESQAIETRPTENAEAYELYLKGRHEQYYLTKESYLRALDLYEQAAAMDSKFTQAYIGIASVCCVYYREYSRNPKWLVRAEASLTNAEAITGETSKSLWIKGMIAWLRGNDDTAIEILTRSGELDPKNHNAFNVLGVFYMARANYYEASQAFERVLETVESPLDYYNLLNALYTGNEYEKVKKIALTAIPVFERYLIREPGDQNVAVQKCLVLFWAGLADDARQMAESLINKSDMNGVLLFNLGYLFDLLGYPQTTISLFRRAIESGHRPIEETRNYRFVTQDPQCETEFQSLLYDLEERIRNESISPYHGSIV